MVITEEKKPTTDHTITVDEQVIKTHLFRTRAMGGWNRGLPGASEFRHHNDFGMRRQRSIERLLARGHGEISVNIDSYGMRLIDRNFLQQLGHKAISQGPTREGVNVVFRNADQHDRRRRALIGWLEAKGQIVGCQFPGFEIASLSSRKDDTGHHCAAQQTRNAG